MRYVGRATRLAAAATLLLLFSACSGGSDEPGNDPTGERPVEWWGLR